MPVVTYKMPYYSACGSTEKRTVKGPTEVIQALENVQVTDKMKDYSLLNCKLKMPKLLLFLKSSYLNLNSGIMILSDFQLQPAVHHHIHMG